MCANGTPRAASWPFEPPGESPPRTQLVPSAGGCIEHDHSPICPVARALECDGRARLDARRHTDPHPAGRWCDARRKAATNRHVRGELDRPRLHKPADHAASRQPPSLVRRQDPERPASRSGACSTASGRTPWLRSKCCRTLTLRRHSSLGGGRYVLADANGTRLVLSTSSRTSFLTVTLPSRAYDVTDLRSRAPERDSSRCAAAASHKSSPATSQRRQPAPCSTAPQAWTPERCGSDGCADHGRHPIWRLSADYD